MKFTSILLLSLAFLISLSCSNLFKETIKNYLPVARGEAGMILIVMDTVKYNSEVGLTLRKILAKPILGLPQPEPHFTIQNINPLKFNKLLKTAKNIIIVAILEETSKQNSALLKYFTNESLKKIKADSSLFMFNNQNNFAKGQEILYLFSKNDQLLKEHIIANASKIRNHFEKVENQRLVKTIFKEEEENITKVLLQDHQFSIRFPPGFKMSANTKNFVWMRFLDKEIEKNIFVYHQPYTSRNPFNDPLGYRESITIKYMRDSQKPDLFMTIQEIVPATYTELNFKGEYAKQTKGLWKLSDISGGGPFISYIFVDKFQNRIYYLEGYVYAPSKDKREPMREIDVILNTFKSREEPNSKK